jgi:hypothetical protein
LPCVRGIGAGCAAVIARRCYLSIAEARLVGWINGLIALNWVVALSVIKGLFAGQLLTFFVSTSVAIGIVVPLVGVEAGLRIFEKLRSQR